MQTPLYASKTVGRAVIEQATRHYGASAKLCFLWMLMKEPDQATVHTKFGDNRFGNTRWWALNRQQKAVASKTPGMRGDCPGLLISVSYDK